MDKAPHSKKIISCKKITNQHVERTVLTNKRVRVKKSRKNFYTEGVS